MQPDNEREQEEWKPSEFQGEAEAPLGDKHANKGDNKENDPNGNEWTKEWRSRQFVLTTNQSAEDLKEADPQQHKLQTGEEGTPCRFQKEDG
jgi:hypothetical protein